jgi:hypothetical protein
VEDLDLEFLNLVSASEMKQTTKRINVRELQKEKKQDPDEKGGMGDVPTILVPTYSQLALQLLIKGKRVGGCKR